MVLYMVVYFFTALIKFASWSIPSNVDGNFPSSDTMLAKIMFSNFVNDSLSFSLISEE